MSTFKVLGICGSLRRASSNMGLLRYAQQHVPEGMSIEIADLADMPFYNADISDKHPDDNLPAKPFRKLFYFDHPLPLVRRRETYFYQT